MTSPYRKKKHGAAIQNMAPGPIQQSVFDSASPECLPCRVFWGMSGNPAFSAKEFNHYSKVYYTPTPHAQIMFNDIFFHLYE